jgi:tripartite-type tricarboxylate transporter receptor subunit TctC
VLVDRGGQRPAARRPGAGARLLRRAALARLEFYLWVGMFAPKGTPDAAVNVLRDAARRSAADENFVKAMRNVGQDIAYLDQPEFRTFWEADARRVEEAVRQIGKV